MRDPPGQHEKVSLAAPFTASVSGIVQDNGGSYLRNANSLELALLDCGQLHGSSQLQKELATLPSLVSATVCGDGCKFRRIPQQLWKGGSPGAIFTSSM